MQDKTLTALLNMERPAENAGRAGSIPAARYPMIQRYKDNKGKLIIRAWLDKPRDIISDTKKLYGYVATWLDTAGKLHRVAFSDMESMKRILLSSHNYIELKVQAKVNGELIDCNV